MFGSVLSRVEAKGGSSKAHKSVDIIERVTKQPNWRWNPEMFIELGNVLCRQGNMTRPIQCMFLGFYMIIEVNITNSFFQYTKMLCNCTARMDISRKK